MNVAFEMIHGDQRLTQGERKPLCVQDADEQRPGESGAFCDRDRVYRRQRDARLCDGLTDHRNNTAQMFARGKLGDDSAISRVQGNLRSDDI